MREEGTGNREEGTGRVKLWLALAAVVVAAVVVVFLSAREDTSSADETAHPANELTATVGVSAGRRPPREGSLERCDVLGAPQSQDD